MAKCGNQMSTELFDHVQRIVMPKGAIKDQGHHLEVIAHQLQSTTDRLGRSYVLGEGWRCT